MTLLSAAMTAFGFALASLLYGMLSRRKERWEEALRFCIVQTVTVAVITLASYHRQPTIPQVSFLIVALSACNFLWESINGKRRWLRALDSSIFVMTAGIACLLISTSL